MAFRFAVVCHCAKHETWWLHSAVAMGMCVANPNEIKLRTTDDKHKGREKKICKACRSCVKVEAKFQNVEIKNADADSDYRYRGGFSEITKTCL